MAIFHLKVLDRSLFNLMKVGAVALDLAGNVASATSTGGITGKRGGRVMIVITMLVADIIIVIVKNPILVTISFSWKVGDSPLAGSGGYADSR